MSLHACIKLYFTHKILTLQSVLIKRGNLTYICIHPQNISGFTIIFLTFVSVPYILAHFNFIIIFLLKCRKKGENFKKRKKERKKKKKGSEIWVIHVTSFYFEIRIRKSYILLSKIFMVGAFMIHAWDRIMYCQSFMSAQVLSHCLAKKKKNWSQIKQNTLS
jgi:hypothetical protein